MVSKVYLAVCDNCDTVSNEPGKCIECMSDMQVVTFVRQASQLTPVAVDCAYCHCSTAFVRDGVNCLNCGRVYKSHIH